MRKLLALIVTGVFLFAFSACDEASPQLSADEALNIALERAGVTRDNIRDLESNLDTENGVLVYEITFESGNTEYSYDINAETGEIVERDIDRGN